MKILFVHNYYVQHGGEEGSFIQEVALLRSRGHEVIEYTRSNAEVAALSPLEKLRLPAHMIWSQKTYDEIAEILRAERPEIAHVNNAHFIVSPSVFHACADGGVPVVSTLRNYRLICPNAQLMRGGQVCEDCMGKTIPWPGVLHACWRDSRMQTAVIAATLTYHRWRHTWTDTITRYIALTEFARRKFIQAGLPSEKIVVRPNFLDPDPGPGQHEGEFALFVGRLSWEKGLNVLLDAYELARRVVTNLPLKIIGDGPLMDLLKQRAAQISGQQIVFEGWQSPDVILNQMQRASVLVVPSIWYEGLPRVLIEAFACGLPVIASNLGSLSELITPGETGLHCEPRDAKSLAEALVWAMHNADQMNAMGRQARVVYEQKYTAQVNYTNLIKIYGNMLKSS